MKTFSKTPLTLAILLTFSSSYSFAQNNKSDDEQMEHIEVNGHKITGAKSVQISDIQRKQAADLEDLLRDQANITVGGSFGAAQKVYVRGIEDTNLNVTIDGAAQSGQIFHHQARLSLDPEMLKQVELKAGAGTALDGFGALGGAIHFTTKDVDDLLDVDDNFGALVKAGYLSNTEGTHLSANLYGHLTESLSALMSLGKREGDAFEDGSGLVAKNTDYNQEVGLFKLAAQLTEQQSVKLSHDVRTDDGKRNLRVHFRNAPWNSATDQKSKRTTTTLTYHFDDQNNLADFSIKAYNTVNRFAYVDSVAGNADSMRIETKGVDIRNNTQLSAHDLTYGLQYKKNKTHHLATLASEQDKAIALYLQDDFVISSDLMLSYGFRYDDYSYDDAFGMKYSADGLSPNANIEYSFNDNWSARLGYSEAIRGQSTKQAIMVGDVHNSEHLKEEEANNAELSLSYQNQGWYFNATVFSTEIENVVAAEGNPWDGFFYTNIGKLESKGLDVTLAKTWQQARIQATYSQNEPEVNGQALSDNQFGIGTSYGDTFILQANYQLSDLDAELGWSSRVVQEMDKVPLGYPAKASFTTHDLYVEWHPAQLSGVTVNLTLHNLFDKYYYDHGTFGFDPDSQLLIGLPEPGRDVRLTVSWLF